MRLSEIAKADLYIMGHAHALGSNRESFYDIQSNKVIQKQPVFVLSGHFLNYLGSYAQQKALKPSGPAGTPKIKLHLDMKRISVSL